MNFHQVLVHSLALFTICAARPQVAVLNGTYEGNHVPAKQQDQFFGIPYARPPIGDLRFRAPRGLNESWAETRSAREYSDVCMQYVSPPGFPMSEDCLTLNVYRPSNVTIGSNESLPVAVWIHGGGLYTGSSRDQDMTNFVWRAAAAGKPLIGVSINYRLNAFGFLWGSEELTANGSANNGLRDQRLALHWIQENIASFGGDPRKVTLFGQSGGALSIGKQLTAYGGRDDGLFRAAIMQSGSMAEKWPYNIQEPTAYTEDLYSNVTASTNCSGQPSELKCLRSLPVEELSVALNVTETPVFYGTGLGPWLTQVDGDFLIDPPTESVRSGRFLPVPIMYTTTSDEATVFGFGGKVDSEADFRAFVAAGGPDPSTVSTIEILYPKVNAIGLPAEYNPTPQDDKTYGAQWKRAVAFHTDVVENTSRRLVLDAWTENGATAYSGRFNMHFNGSSPRLGSPHGTEIPYLFDSVTGEQADGEYAAMSELIGLMWASFVVDLDPNNHGVAGAAVWPSWNTSTVDGVGSSIVFDTDEDGASGTFVEKDDFRLAQTKYLGSIMSSQMYY